MSVDIKSTPTCIRFRAHEADLRLGRAYLELGRYDDAAGGQRSQGRKQGRALHAAPEAMRDKLEQHHWEAVLLGGGGGGPGAPAPCL